ncbi:fumarylacetoacetate hydrolase family protein [Tissierella carlieri]|uniref:fumarylacetoacetate hydrolase family protein n=1 Tax=Tissierella carlieri TaxID=689904 RepID=UPI001C11385C|nr:fumarylacetoacetate hydrolase family protein [Tissierella carlieri]MBU5312760.1 fumarylacetoacetate hydrolase family protein [Tissierella carlieri]
MIKYIRFVHKEQVQYGILHGENIEILHGNSFSNFEKSNTFINIDEINLLPPCTPQKIICTGLNYSDTILEDGASIPKKPLIFLKAPSAIIGNEDSIIKNQMIETLTCEAELAIVIGKKGKCISVEDADSYIWGYLMANDVTAKDLQKEDIQWTRAKSFDTFLPLSYEIVGDIESHNLEIRTIVNGNIVQKGNTKDMIFDIPYLISYISNVMTLYEGDIILTGTPGGYGKVIDDGDTVIIEIEKLGSINNTVISSNNSWCLK